MTTDNIRQLIDAEVAAAVEVGVEAELAKLGIPLTPSPIRIVISDRGWVHVGRWTENDGIVSLSPGRVVRRWGTTQGLAQLANDGPSSETKLDAPATVRVHSVLAEYDCAPDKWERHLR